MTYTQDELLQLIYDTRALSIWNRQKGPVFWYIAGVPGPFYVNTELLIGTGVAEELLGKINLILSEAAEPAERARRIKDVILGAYKDNPVYQKVIATMLAKADVMFPVSSYDFVSGGERRDWLFSIPFALGCGKKHVYLFKKQTAWCEESFTPGEKGLHVADLINNAASYFDLWFPALEKQKLSCIGTACIITRGANGVSRLKKHGQRISALASINLPFFQQSLKNGLIDKDTLEEIGVFFESDKKWASKYLIGRSDLFDVKTADKKSFERLQSFFTNDPWSLRKDHEGFFSEMQKAIATKA